MNLSWKTNLDIALALYALEEDRTHDKTDYYVELESIWLES